MKYPHAQKISILIIDDKEDMRKSMLAQLKESRLGKYYFEASNGQDAWEFLERCREPLHMIISGLKLPRITGPQLLVKVRATKKYRTTPFLMVSAEADRETVAMVGESEVDAYLTIPFNTETFAKKIQDLVDRASNPSPWTKHMNRARSFEERGNLKVAIREAREAVKLSKRRASKPLRELGRLYLKQERLEDGLECFQEATTVNSLDVASFHFLGKTYFELEKMEDAMTAFSKAMEINPRHNDRSVTYAKVLLKEDKRDEAQEILEKAVAHSADDLDFTEDIIELCMDNGLDELAAKACDGVLKKDPDRKYLRQKQGTALFKSGKTKESEKILQKSVKEFDGSLDLMVELANSYLQSKDIPKAKEAAHMIMQMDPKNKDAKKILDQCAPS